jgi:transcription elongation GreA/GreB family factor
MVADEKGLEAEKATHYEAENAKKIVDDLFSGRLSLEQALQRLRTRLLDLSSKNRLLNYRYPKNRCIQFVNKPNLNLVFNRLIDGKSLLVKYVMDPPPESYTIKRPEVKAYAESLGIDINTEFESSCRDSHTNKHTPKLQALYYPVDLEKLCRKLTSESRTIIEETGTNMLYLVFGFLEFLDREDSEKTIRAPLLAVPITLFKGDIDASSRTYQYSIIYSGEDIHENQTLREKLSQDFSLQLPEFDEEEELGKYFEKIHQAVHTKKGWGVRYQLALGFLSFGKLAIWNDLDPKKWPSLLNHSLLKEIFSGGAKKSSDISPEDYDIDNHPQGDLQLIYNADSSQHSAIIDVLSGKNMVINGPPGTGKSQTITNVIATSLKAGKKVLFVSEKLAALEVVRHRLNQANMGHFCLELHSHKTQKKKLLGELHERLEKKFNQQLHLNDKIQTLNRHKKELNRYAQLMASRFDNELGLTVYEIFWRAERQRQIIGELANAVQGLFLPSAPRWSFDDIKHRRAKLDILGQHYATIDRYDSTHPWWGFTPNPLAPGDNEAIISIITEALLMADELAGIVSDYQEKVGLEKEPTFNFLEQLLNILNTLQDPPGNLKAELLVKVFDASRPQINENLEVLISVIRKVEQARELHEKADLFLSSNCELNFDDAEPIVAQCSKELSTSSFSVPLNVLEELVHLAKLAHNRFEGNLSHAPCSYIPIQTTMLETIDSKIRSITPLVLLNQPIQRIKEGESILVSAITRFRQALERITKIAINNKINFDTLPDEINKLGGSNGIDEILPGVLVDNKVVEKAQKAAGYLFSGMPISEINKRHQILKDLHDRITRAFNEIKGYAGQLGFHFDGTKNSVNRLVTLGQIASCAPSELFDFRRTTFAHPSTIEIITKAEAAHSSEKTQWELLSKEFYIDALPLEDALKDAIRGFRRGDSLFNFLNSEWRFAKKLFNSICKKKKKYKAVEYEAFISDIISWMDHRSSFINNEEYKATFGQLFKGLDTDFAKIRSLHSWYIESYKEILKHPGFINIVDLTTIESTKINQLAALSQRLKIIVSEIEECNSQVMQLLSPVSNQLDNILSQNGWEEYNRRVMQFADGLKTVFTFLNYYVHPTVSPKRALEVLNAKTEFASINGDFDTLNHAVNELHKTLEPLLPGFASLQCHRWSDYLRSLSQLAQATNELVELFNAYDNTSTIQQIRTFCEGKLALDFCLDKFALSSTDYVKDWKSYVSTAAQRIEAGSRLTQLLKPVGAIGKNASEILVGLSNRKDANALISGIEEDTTVINILKGLFKGCNTDLDCLAATLSWGESINNNVSIHNASVNSFLLANEATTNFFWTKEILHRIIKLRDAINNKLNELSEFGSFSWYEWNSHGYENEGGDLSTNLRDRIDDAASHMQDVLSWAKYHMERSACNKIELEDFVICLEQKKIPYHFIGEVFEFVVYRSIGRYIYKSLPELKGFSGAKHDKKRSEFMSLDQEIINLTGNSFAYEIDKSKIIPQGESSYRASELTEMQLIWRELGKQKRHLPIRQFIKRAGRAIQALKPCFMMGPMSVAQYLEQGAVVFDIVVMDEASQLRPEEALGAIARGKQLIVVGDPKQLPPTNFFDRMLEAGDDDDDSDAPMVLTGVESILDICQQLFHPVRTLRWHYRSQHESLIAFSNHHFYNGKLVVFPSPFDRNKRLGVRYRYIRNGVYQNRQNVNEAHKLVDCVIEHMMKYPEESLGVVTLNLTQRDLIEDFFDKKMRDIKEAQKFVSHWEEEGWPFFVKNLENVQGDERDVIFISTTFGKAPGTDKARQNFGPISRPDGWRRLNVLFTRARRKIELFTSMLPEDIIVDAKTPAGTKALRDYLDFAKSGVLTSSTISTRNPDSDFEVAVGDILKNKGYDIVPQLGVAGFFIDLAVRNPDRPGEFLVAVECDGATYHSSKSARDRDRIRQDILESLGWKDRIWRIWSTDWFYDQRHEAERLLNFIEECRTKVRSGSGPDYEMEEEFDEVEETIESPDVKIGNETVGSTLTISKEDLFAEVGDSVTYCFSDKPEERKIVTIVDIESNPELSLINENTPLAKALLNAAVGDESEMEIKGNPSRMVRILRVHRQNEREENS